MRYASGHTSNKAKKNDCSALFKQTSVLRPWRRLWSSLGAPSVDAKEPLVWVPVSWFVDMLTGNMAILMTRWLYVDYFWLPAVPGPAVTEGPTRDNSDINRWATSQRHQPEQKESNELLRLLLRLLRLLCVCLKDYEYFDFLVLMRLQNPVWPREHALKLMSRLMKTLIWKKNLWIWSIVLLETLHY